MTMIILPASKLSCNINFMTSRTLVVTESALIVLAIIRLFKIIWS
jgi:hypothetical protein